MLLFVYFDYDFANMAEHSWEDLVGLLGIEEGRTDKHYLHNLMVIMEKLVGQVPQSSGSVPLRVWHSVSYASVQAIAILMHILNK